MTVVVRGATLIDIPNPSTTDRREERDPVAAADAGNGEECESAGRAMVGPMTSGAFAP